MQGARQTRRPDSFDGLNISSGSHGGPGCNTPNRPCGATKHQQTDAMRQVIAAGRVCDEQHDECSILADLIERAARLRGKEVVIFLRSGTMASTIPHFRAGFDVFFPDARISELDVPGMTSNVPENFNFKGLRRPSYPLAPDTEWHLPERFAPVENAG